MKIKGRKKKGREWRVLIHKDWMLIIRKICFKKKKIMKDKSISFENILLYELIKSNIVNLFCLCFNLI